jgi:hypothetical protein
MKTRALCLLLAVALAFSSLPEARGSGFIGGGTVTSAALDSLLGTTQGTIAERGSSAWGTVGPGTLGQFFMSKGAGANPIFTSTLTNNAALINGGFGFGLDLAMAGSQGVVGISTFGVSGQNNGPNFWGQSARGTPASPTGVQTDDLLCSFAAFGRGATGFSPSARALVDMYAAENWTDSAQGTYIHFTTTPVGSTTPAEAFRINANGSLSASSGNFTVDPTAGTVTVGVAGMKLGPNDIIVPNARFIYWTNRAQIASPADSVVELLNNAGTGFSRLDLGGTTSSFVALQSSGTTLTIGDASGGTAGSVVVGGATGGSQGNGTLNATGLFVNGVAVGGASSLTSVLGVGNTTSGKNIIVTSGDTIQPSADNVGGLGTAALRFQTIYGTQILANAGASTLALQTNIQGGAGVSWYVQANGLTGWAPGNGSLADVALARNAAGVLELNNGTLGTITGTLKLGTTLASDGGASNPSFSFTGATTTGFWRSSVTTIAYAVAGQTYGLFTSAGIVPGIAGMTLGNATTQWSQLYINYTNTATVGAVTINKASGRVNIAAAGTSVVVTYSLVTAKSHVFVVASTADATAQVKNVVPAAGSFTITTTATTAQTSFDFFVVNAD